MERMNKREKKFYGVIGRPFMQGFSFGSEGCWYLVPSLLDKIHNHFSAIKAN